MPPRGYGVLAQSPSKTPSVKFDSAPSVWGGRGKRRFPAGCSLPWGGKGELLLLPRGLREMGRGWWRCPRGAAAIPHPCSCKRAGREVGTAAAEPGQTQPSRVPGHRQDGPGRGGRGKQRVSRLGRWVGGWTDGRTDIAASGEAALKLLTDSIKFPAFGLALLVIERPFNLSPCPRAASVRCPNGLLRWAELGRGGMPGGVPGSRQGAELGPSGAGRRCSALGGGRGTMRRGTGDASLEHAGL